MKLRIGLDMGSAAIKVAVLDGERLVRQGAAATVPGQELAAKELIRSVLDGLGVGFSDIEGLAATGYGKKLFSGADKVLDEISANALGAFKLSGGAARVVANMGGQDMKAIFLGASGEVIDFRMNDKCAAGTGRFFEQAARILDAPLASFADLARTAATAAELNSTCVVFAESEMVSLMADGVPRGNIIKGLCRAAARRVAALLGMGGNLDGLYLDGGPAMNPELAEALAEELLLEVRVLPNPQFTAAAGAAYSL